MRFGESSTAGSPRIARGRVESLADVEQLVDAPEIIRDQADELGIRDRGGGGLLQLLPERLEAAEEEEAAFTCDAP